MTWSSIIIAGVLTYFTRMTMIALINRDMLGDRIKAVLAYVPSAVFPAIIFPGIFLNDYGAFIEINLFLHLLQDLLHQSIIRHGQQQWMTLQKFF